MDPVVALLLKNGVFGIVAGIGFYLYFRERKLNQEYAQTYLNHQVEDTKAKAKLTTALEDVAQTVQALGAQSRNDIAGCKANVDRALDRIDKYIEEQKVKRAREEGRREATNPRMKIPGWTGEDDES